MDDTYLWSTSVLEDKIEDPRSKSSPSGMRFSGRTEGNSAESFHCQSPMLGHGLVGNSLLKGSVSGMVVCPSGKIAARGRYQGDGKSAP